LKARNAGCRLEQNPASVVHQASLRDPAPQLQEPAATSRALSRTISAVNMDTPQAPLQPDIPDQPGIAARAIDTATDVSRTIGEVTGALSVAVDRLSAAIADARRPGRPLAIISAMTRQAPLTSLIVAFTIGLAVARRR